jgi:hypothetical protein
MDEAMHAHNAFPDLRAGAFFVAIGKIATVYQQMGV